MPERMVMEWKQPEGTATQLATPMDGGLLLLDTKRQPGETQFIDFILDGRAYWSLYPNDHLYVVLDATLNGQGKAGRTGRGAIFNRSKIAFEDFGRIATWQETPFNMLDRYRVVVHASDRHAAWFVFVPGGPLLGRQFTEMADETPDALVSQIIVGATSDFNPPGPKVPAVLGIEDLRIGRFVPGN